MRLNQSFDGGSDDEDQENIDFSEAGRYVRAPVTNYAVVEDQEEGDVETTDCQYDNSNEGDQNCRDEDLRKQVAHLQNALAGMAARLNSAQKREDSANDAEESWTYFRDRQTSQPERNTQSLRWEQMKPFPKNVAANKMWEEWTKYIDNFEIAASLSNATDPARRAQLLFLSMGEELQGIVRAAKLRPNLNDGNCYSIFTRNIGEHLRSLTDTAAEHEAFSSMRQEKGETAIKFHSRLVEKVRLCRYNPDDQDRFVRAQLLKGMANRELAKAARTYGYETDFVVQSATRDEAYQCEVAQPAHDETINQVRGRLPFKRTSGSGLAGGSQNKYLRRNKDQPSGRRERCSKCNRWAHRNRSCPALKQKCHECGSFGHYAVVCRKKRVNNIEDDSSLNEAKTETRDEEVK